MTGCKEEFPVYSTFCDGNSTAFPDCLHYTVFDVKDKKALEVSFGIAHSDQCTYRVELIKYHVGSCNNPVVKSRGSDFNGYVRVEIKKGFKCYYKIQSDYKDDVNAAFDRVLKRVKIDVNQEKKIN
jgi:hypothetical protein